MISLNELRETLEFNRNSLKENRMLTNELIVDDFMVELGYNKKRDTSVKRLYTGEVDWEVVEATGNRIAVKVFAIGETLNDDEIQSTFNFCADKRFSILLILKGDSLVVYRFNKESRNYNEVYNINLSSELDEKAINILTAISKNSFNLETIDNLCSDKDITVDNVIDILSNNIEDLVNKVIENINSNSTSIKEQCNTIINDLLHPDKLVNTDNAELDKLKNENETLKKLLESKDNEITELNIKLESMDSTSGVNISSDTDNDEINSYREQIQELTIKLSDANEEVSRLKSELENAQSEIDNMSGADRKRAQELLGVIEDNPELNRHYVGVINTELIQFDELHTFIGRSLQKLYEIKSFEASQFIFNGDIFRLVQPATRNDIIMNNKAYDIEIEGQHEDEVLNKIRIVFSHFDDVIFECKKIGTLNKESVSEQSEQSEIINDEIDTESEIELDTEVELDASDITDNTLDEEFDVSDTSDNSGFISLENDIESFTDDSEILTDDSELFTGEPEFENESFENDVDSLVNTAEDSFGLETAEDSFDELETDEDKFEVFEDAKAFSGVSLAKSDSTFEPDNDAFGDLSGIDEFVENSVEMDTFNNMQTSLLVVQMLQLDQLIWNDEEIKFNTIKYLGNNSTTFNININCDDMSCEQLLCKCIDAILALEVSKGNNALINLFKQKDFSLVNNFLKLYTEEYRDYPRINGTKYAIVGVESVQQVASILYDICESMKIDMSELFIYFDTLTSSEFIVSNYGYSDDAVNLVDNQDYIRSDSINEAVAVINGNIFNNIVVTKNSLKAHKDILVKCLAVKTRYLGKVINSLDDVKEVVEQMFVEALKLNPILNLQAFGNVVGENHCLISCNKNEVGENPISIEYQDGVIYMANIETWQILHSLIKIHTVLFNNTAIAVKVVVDINSINYYGKSFEASDPSLHLAVKSFVDFVASNIK